MLFPSRNEPQSIHCRPHRQRAAGRHRQRARRSDPHLDRRDPRGAAESGRGQSRRGHYRRGGELASDRNRFTSHSNYSAARLVKCYSRVAMSHNPFTADPTVKERLDAIVSERGEAIRISIEGILAGRQKAVEGNLGGVITGEEANWLQIGTGLHRILITARRALSNAIPESQ